MLINDPLFISCITKILYFFRISITLVIINLCFTPQPLYLNRSVEKKINGTQTVIHVHVPLIDRLTIDHEQKKPIYIVGIPLLQ